MQVSPYSLLGASTLAALEQRCNAMLDAWAGAWGVERSACALDCARAWDTTALRPGQWQRHYAQAEQAVWIGWPDQLARALQARMFAPDQRHAPDAPGGASLAAQSAAEACAALADALAAAAAPGVRAPADSGTAAPPARLFRSASGAVMVALRIAEQSMLCVLNHACLDLPAPQKLALPARTDLRGVLGYMPVTLSVSLGQVEVDVSQLLTLAVGDVIRLDSHVDQPVTVTGPDGQALFGAHLGSADGTIVVEAVRHASH
ncbi:FliM/FliN family flagellar motor C-terminal domain-containing protein [Massilia sp. DJPM01]|uniref:FliM/FliN family flagellar motor C-terminal domain-containing protein n=1 Tax=Massilia sp. DJPM01 TaxID=3024404 RepID=UPI00259FCFB6|nr:FliM/FliN family flagellar motor C-terminal domain-containing protein [Massilia sp. DJPM01]MDM5179184.1 FliM/FliN family flagellar motor C-terminal domain-containing protein [Massilia sp. DJPM01]